MTRRLPVILFLTATFLCLAPGFLGAQRLRLSTEVCMGANTGIAGHAPLGLQAEAGLGLTQLWPVGNRHYRQARHVIRTRTPQTAMGWYAAVQFCYTRNTFTHDIHDSYQRTDYLGHTLDYTNTGTIHSIASDMALDIPIMLAFHYRGLLLRAGVLNRLPLSTTLTQDISNLQIQARYAEYGVTLVNELITGRANDEQLHQRLRTNDIRYAAGPSLEVGYLWHHCGLLLSTNYLIGAIRTPGSADSAQPFVDVAPIRNAENPVPEVSVTTKAYSLSTIGFSLRFIYLF